MPNFDEPFFIEFDAHDDWGLESVFISKRKTKDNDLNSKKGYPGLVGYDYKNTYKLGKANSAAYALTREGQIHPVFHVRAAKEKRVEATVTALNSSSGAEDGEISVVPEALLDTRWVKKGSKFVEESLVQWSGLPKEDATWENTEELREKFISMNLEDKVPQKEGSNDKPTRRSTRVPITNRRYLK
ncbi:transposon Tf2-12 polyprotein [Tanacetum coccineum]